MSVHLSPVLCECIRKDGKINHSNVIRELSPLFLPEFLVF